MEYKITRVSDSDELYHWGKKKDHKYIARVKDKKGKWRYFYNKKEYDAYRKLGEKDSGSIFTKMRNKIKSTLCDLGIGFVRKMKKTKLYEVSDKVESGIDYVEKLLNESGSSKKHKYIEKVKLPSGKWRYFYTQEEYDSYLKRKEYQKNEPEFMKDVPEIDESLGLNNDDHMKEINEEYNPLFTAKDDYAYSMNCMYCTTAYELRQRGYDVEAAEFKEETYSGNVWDLAEWYENGELKNIEPNSATITDATKYIDGSDSTHNDYYTHALDRMYDWSLSDEPMYSGKDIVKTLEKNNEPNSRGNLLIMYGFGGGHSIAYETDSKGKVTIRDCQTNEIYTTKDLDRMTWALSDVMYMRTDNLELKEGVFETIDNN